MRIPAFFTKLLLQYFRFIAAAVVIVILAAGYALLIRTKVDTLRTSGYLERANVERELQSEQALLQRLQESNAKFHRVLPDDKLAAIDKFVPTGSDFPGLLLTIRNIASAAGLDLSALAVSETTAVTTAPLDQTSSGADTAQAATVSGVALRTQDVLVTVTRGQNYETFKRFLALLETSQRLLDVVTLSFTHDATSSDQGSTYTVTLRSYYLPSS